MLDYLKEKKVLLTFQSGGIPKNWHSPDHLIDSNQVAILSQEEGFFPRDLPL